MKEERLGCSWAKANAKTERYNIGSQFISKGKTPTHSSVCVGVSSHQLLATSLMRAIISSTAFSVGTFSFKMRFIALAHTFSLFNTVNL